MARVRNIHPDGPKDEAVAKCTIAARYVWDRLPCYADRAGRLADKPFSLRIDIFPTDPITTEQMDGYLAELAKEGLIVRYEVAGRRYIVIPNFLRYQNPHRNEASSRIPPPADDVGHRGSSLSPRGMGALDACAPPSPPADLDQDPGLDQDPEPQTRARVIPEPDLGAWPEPMPEPVRYHHGQLRVTGLPPPRPQAGQPPTRQLELGSLCDFHAGGRNAGKPAVPPRAACTECQRARQLGNRARPPDTPKTAGEIMGQGGWPPRAPPDRARPGSEQGRQTGQEG